MVLPQPSLCFCLHYLLIVIIYISTHLLSCLSVYNLSISSIYKYMQDYKNLLEFCLFTMPKLKPYYPYKLFLSLGRDTG